MEDFLVLNRTTYSATKSRIIKIYFIILFCTIIFSTVLAWKNPADNFEISIYSSTPSLFWICMFFVLASSIVLFVLFLYHNNTKPNKYTYLCIISIFLSYILINSLFIIRGYYMWNISGDGATHLGWTNNLILNGSLPKELFYPVIHIFLAILVYTSDLNLIILHKIVPILFLTLFVPFMYLFTRLIFPKKHASPVIATLLSCCFLLPSTLLAPNQNSNMIFPFLLAVYVMTFIFKENKPEYRLFLIICLFFITFFHPISAIIFGLIIFSVNISKPISLKYPKIVGHNPSKNIMNSSALILLIVFFIYWIIHFLVFKTTINNMYDSITQIGNSQYDVMSQAIDNAKLSGQNYIVEITKRFGKYILVIFLSYIDIFLLYRKNLNSNNYQTLMLFSFPFTAIMLFMILIISSMGFSMAARLLDYILILGIIFCSHLLFKLLESSLKKGSSYLSVEILLIIGIIFSLMSLGIFDIYPSPYNEKGSYHSTEKSIEGMKWFFAHRNVEVPLIGITIAPGRYADLLLSSDEAKKQKLPYYMYSLQKYGIDDHRPPFHFNYNTSAYLGERYPQETDLITNQLDVKYYSITRPQLESFCWRPDDFNMLMNDSTVNKIYWDSEYTVWKIIP